MKLIYTEEELPQRSEEWLKMRESTIGASETGAILGLLTKYEKPKTVWKRKTGRLKKKKENEAMFRGKELEEEAKEATLLHLIKEENIENPQAVPYFAKHPNHDFIAVSFDGVDLENGFITELKCPKFVTVFKSVFENGIQNYYYCQVQQQLAVAKEHWGIEKGFFSSYYPQGAYIFSPLDFKEYLKYIAVIDIEFDETYWNAMLKVLTRFNQNVKNDSWDDEEYNELIKEFKDVTQN
jgi:putative phage-type endonuclease